MSCSCCFKAEIGSCINSLTINAALPTEGNYVLSVEDKFGRIYEQPIIAYGENLSFDFDLDEVPEGFFNEFAGSFVITIRLLGDCDNTQMLISDGYNTVSYNCIEVTAVNHSTQNQIGCPQ